MALAPVIGGQKVQSQTIRTAAQVGPWDREEWDIALLCDRRNS